MKNRYISFILVFCILFTIFVFIPGNSTAEHATCHDILDDDEHDYYCDFVIDWEDRFSKTMIDGASLHDVKDNEIYPFLYNDINTLANHSTKEQLINAEYYPYEYYEHPDSTEGFIYTNTVDPNNSPFILERVDDKSITSNSYENQPTQLLIDLKYELDDSDNTTIEDKDINLEIIVREVENGNRIDTYTIDENDISNRTEDEWFYYTAEIETSVENSKYKIEYNPSVDGDAGVYTGAMLLNVGVPEYILFNYVQDTYYNETDELNRELFNHYHSNILGIEEDGYVTTPAYDKDKFYHKSTRTYFDDVMDDGEQEIITHAYSQIEDVAPSIKTPVNPSEKEWDKIVSEDGTISVNYGSAVGEEMERVDEGEGSGNEFFVPNLENIEYELEFGYITHTGVKQEIETTTQTQKGIHEFTYDENDFQDHHMVEGFYVDTSVLHEYRIEEWFYSPIYDNCPSREEVRSSLPDKCGNEFTDEMDGRQVSGCQYEDVAPSGCSSPSDTYISGYEEIFDNEYYEEFEIDGIEDEILIDSFAENETVNERYFDIYETTIDGERRIFVDRDLSHDEISHQENRESRWTNMQSRTKTVDRNFFIDGSESDGERTRRDSFSIIDRATTEEYRIDEKIPNDANVYIDLWYTGGITENKDYTIKLNNNSIEEDSFMFDRVTTERPEMLLQNENVTEYLAGEEIVELDYIYDSEVIDTTKPNRINYRISIELDDVQTGFISSTWDYVNFRDSSWDALYNFDEDTPESHYNYDSRDIFDASNRGVPDNEDWINSPSEVQPIQTYLLPTTNSLKSNSGILPEYDVILHPTEEIEGETFKGISTDFNPSIDDSAQEGFHVNSIETPIRSENCPNQLEKDINNLCNIDETVLANSFFERTYGSTLNFRPDIDTEELSEQRNESFPPSTKDLLYYQTTESAATFDRDFDTITEFNTKYFTEPGQFEIQTERKISNFEIAGDVSWNYNSDIDTEYIPGVNSTITVEHLEEEDINMDERDELLENLSESNNQIINPGHNNTEFQLRITLKDENGEPIDTTERPDSEQLIVEDSAWGDGPRAGDRELIETEIETNENGVAYATVYPPNYFEIEDGDEVDFNSMNFDVRYEVTDDWWEYANNDYRYVSNSSVSISGETLNISDTGDGESDMSLFDLLFALFGLFFITTLVLYYFANLNPEKGYTYTEIVKVMFEPFIEAFREVINFILPIILFIVTFYFVTTAII